MAGEPVLLRSVKKRDNDKEEIIRDSRWLDDWGFWAQSVAIFAAQNLHYIKKKDETIMWSLLFNLLHQSVVSTELTNTQQQERVQKVLNNIVTSVKNTA